MPRQTVPPFFVLYGQKTRIPTDSHIFVCYSPLLPSGQWPPYPDRLKNFRSMKYDLRNRSYRSAIIVPQIFYFTAKKLEFCPIPIFS